MSQRNEVGGFMTEEDCRAVPTIRHSESLMGLFTDREYLDFIKRNIKETYDYNEKLYTYDYGHTGVPMQEQADRFNDGKPELSYVFDAPLAMQGLANRFALGAKKYSRDNWKKGLPTVQIIDSLLRHISAYQNGEMHDEDGGMHVDAIVWNAVVLSEQFHRQENPIVR